MLNTQHEDWSGKVAIVTGGSSGIGRATAIAFANAGAKVIVSGRTKSKLDAVSKINKNILTIAADSSDPSSADEIVEFALKAGGRIDTLINNAGAGSLQPITDYDNDTILNQCATNIIAPSLLLKAALPALKKSKGSIVNICTAVSRNASPNLAHYGATKAALEHLTTSWAIELAVEGVRVNAVAPGPVKSGALTGMMGLDAETAAMVEEAEAKQVPLGRRGTTDDIIPWILAFAGESSLWTTGQILTVDGGWSQRS